MTGPTSGAITRNGASEITRKSSTRGLAASADTLKKIEAAIEIAKHVSAAACRQCITVKPRRRPLPTIQLATPPSTPTEREA
jgi:hypothetical protein